MRTNHDQYVFDFNPPPLDCEHESGFYSNAYVPGGYFCDDCNHIVYRDMPPEKNQPDLIGYVTADWAWKYKHGNGWTEDKWQNNEASNHP